MTNYIIIAEMERALDCRMRYLRALESFDPSVYLTETDRVLAVPRIRAARMRVAETEQRLNAYKARLAEINAMANAA